MEFGRSDHSEQDWQRPSAPCSQKDSSRLHQFLAIHCKRTKFTSENCPPKKLCRDNNSHGVPTHE